MQSRIVPVDRDIEGVTYRVIPLGAKVGRVTHLRLIKMVAPFIGSLGSLVGQGSEAGFTAAVEKLDPKDVEHLYDLFVPKTSFSEDDGNTWPELSHHFDDHFAANYFAMTKWLVFCLEVNFGSFFSGVRATAAPWIQKTIDAGLKAMSQEQAKTPPKRG